MIRLADVLKKIVHKRKIPEQRGRQSKPKVSHSTKTKCVYGPKYFFQVVMKLDIEGSELEAVPDLLLSGALQNVDKVFVEWHVDRITGRRLHQMYMVREMWYYLEHND